VLACLFFRPSTYGYDGICYGAVFAIVDEIQFKLARDKMKRQRRRVICEHF
jgi:hypothetical protein